MAGHRSNHGKRPHSQSGYSESGGNKRRYSGSDKDLFSIGPDDTVYRYLCPGKKIGSIIGRGGEIVKQLRLDTKSKIRIGESVPGSEERVVTIYSAEDSDEAPHVTVRLLVPSDQIGYELVQISGDASVVKKALYQIASRLHDNPSRSQHLLSSAIPTVYPSNNSVLGPSAGAPIMGLTPLMGHYGGYKRGDMIINQIRQDSGAGIKVDSSTSEGDECVIAITAKELFEDSSPAIDAAFRLQPRCRGSIISEMRKVTKANIRILSKENLPKVASEDDEMVQVSGDLDVAKDALIQVTSRLRANLFEKEGAVSTFLPVLPYLSMSADGSDSYKYESRDLKSCGRGGYSYSGGYGVSGDLPPVDAYGGYGGLQSGSAISPYGAYGGSYSSGRSVGSGLSGRNPASRGRNYDY
ncbi:RNA-binding KH domain-containing protein RCF3 [Salvia divinorum]|uniref:RNA-binding KH domain-containing protein RCF3 n=1 Tax=Salvia divinorum TaxID=28513 RepID=A0ABD1HLY8_SALDI